MVILKCDHRLAEAFRAEYPDVVPGFYSDKRNWNSVYLDGTVPETLLQDICVTCPTLWSWPSFPKKVRETL